MEQPLGFVPIKYTFLVGVPVSNFDDEYKSHHRPEDIEAVANQFRETECPWVHEDDFNIKEDENHSNEVEFN